VRLRAGTLLVAALALAPAWLPAPARAGDSDQPARMRLQSDEYSLGSPAAPVTIVEFTDYQCPYCRRFEAETWPKLKHDYVDTGKVRFIVRDLPLTEIHPAARPAAQAAHCAGDQGKFWPMHDALLSGPTDLLAGGIERRAKTLGLDVDKLKACMASGKYAFRIAQNAAEADALGLRGTPSFVIGRVQGNELTGEAAEGSMPYADLDDYLKELLAAR
jgi:protein-disulfide isomerase